MNAGTSGALAGPFLLWRIAETGKRHASNAPASLSLKVSRFVSSSVPPTGADKGRVQSECPHRLAVPFVVTNRAGKRSRAGHALAVRPLPAACDAWGWSPSAKTFASRGEPFRELACFAGKTS